MTWKSGIERLRQCEFPYIPIDAAMMFTTVIPQSGALWIELRRKVNAASRAGEIDDTWLDHFFQAAATDAKIDALSTNMQSKTSNPSSSGAAGKRPTLRKACEQCMQSSTSGRFTCSQCGYDHCDHMHQRGTLPKKTDPDEPSCRNNLATTSTRPKALLASVALAEVPEEGEETSISTTDVHGSSIDNELDVESCVDGVDCYPANFFILPSPAALLTSDPVALMALHQHFQALFDSGCTHHIIKDRGYFWTYHPEGAIPVGTASSGTLTTKARGIVKVRVRTEQSGAPVVLTLHDCLHGPDSPFNLLSVGAFLEANMPVSFQTNGVAVIHLPSNHPTLCDLSFKAEIHGRLVFLQCDFVPPPSPCYDDPALPSQAMAYTTFTPRE